MGAVGLAALLASPAPAGAATSLEGASLSPDITVSLDGAVVDGADVADDALAGSATRVAFPGLPAGADLVAYHLLPGGDELLVFDVTVALPGGVTATPRDVLRLSAGTWSIEYAGNASLPAGSRIDALATAEDGALLLSFDVTVALGSTVFDDADLARLGGGGIFNSFFDASAHGLPAAADLDAAHRLANDNLLLSFDITGQVDGTTFDDEDVVEFNPRSASFSLAYDGSARYAALAAADLDALDGLPADTDADGLRDDADNCIEVPNGPLLTTGPEQRDTDADGYGNLCDADLDQSLIVNFADLAIFRGVFFSNDPDADLNGDGFVNFNDLARLQQGFFQPPGPSACGP